MMLDACISSNTVDGYTVNDNALSHSVSIAASIAVAVCLSAALNLIMLSNPESAEHQ